MLASLSVVRCYGTLNVKVGVCRCERNSNEQGEKRVGDYSEGMKPWLDTIQKMVAI